MPINPAMIQQMPGVEYEVGPDRAELALQGLAGTAKGFADRKAAKDKMMAQQFNDLAAANMLTGMVEEGAPNSIQGPGGQYFGVGAPQSSSGGLTQKSIDKIKSVKEGFKLGTVSLSNMLGQPMKMKVGNLTEAMSVLSTLGYPSEYFIDELQQVASRSGENLNEFMGFTMAPMPEKPGSRKLTPKKKSGTTMPAATQFKPGDTQVKNGVTYRRAADGGWDPIK